MQPGVLLLMLCVGVLLLAPDLEANHEKAIISLNSRLLRSTTLPANPSVHIALRLSEHHSFHDELSYLHRLKIDLRRKLSRSRLANEPSTGLTALYVLALRASCQGMSEKQAALSYLKKKLAAEQNHTTHHQVLLSNHYQYSLGVLTLCVNNIRLDHSVLSGLMSHDHHHHNHHHHHSIDTLAMEVLALQCVVGSKVPSRNSWMYSQDRRAKAQKAVNKLMERMRRWQASSGEIGNIYSTSLALQAFIATGDQERWLKGRNHLLKEAKRGAFQNPMALSQLLPVLYQKTYLDIQQMDCRGETGDLKQLQLKPLATARDPEPSSQPEFVYLSVKDKNFVTTYSTRVPLSNQMSLLQVLHEAKSNDTNFKFETVPTLWGPFLVSVNGVTGQDSTRTYWRLISGTDTPLIQGIQDYQPQPGEHILLQLSDY
ncbi:transcobalamin-2 [Narcine bancroftii]|uniref:transcobalamin-2 n=1 Tax=Narcine bancroftii TaxID=1343680 RepID=UPI00383103B3